MKTIKTKREGGLEKEVLKMLELELKFCLQNKNKESKFAEGFMEGIKQAIFIIKAFSKL